MRPASARSAPPMRLRAGGTGRRCGVRARRRLASDRSLFLSWRTPALAAPPLQKPGVLAHKGRNRPKTVPDLGFSAVADRCATGKRPMRPACRETAGRMSVARTARAQRARCAKTPGFWSASTSEHTRCESPGRRGFFDVGSRFGSGCFEVFGASSALSADGCRRGREAAGHGTFPAPTRAAQGTSPRAGPRIAAIRESVQPACAK